MRVYLYMHVCIYMYIHIWRDCMVMITFMLKLSPLAAMETWGWPNSHFTSTDGSELYAELKQGAASLQPP